MLEFGNGPMALTPATRLSAVEQAWITPTPDFRLSRLTLSGDPVELSVGFPQILVCTHGSVRLQDGDQVLDLVSGGSVFVPAHSTGVRLTATDATLFRALPGL